MATTSRIIKPVPEGTYITQLWGANPSYYQANLGIPYHNGVDWAAQLNTPVRCMADGVAAWVDYDEAGYGHYVRVYHPALKICSFYAHLTASQSFGIGETVPLGELIGPMGSSGNSTGPHLHFEIRLMLDEGRYAISPYAGMGRGRINPLTFYETLDRLQ